MVNTLPNYPSGFLTMMGRQPDCQHKLFISGFNLDKRIRKDHILSKIKEKIDFDFIYDKVKKTYGTNGNVSVPPPVILKLMLLLLLYMVRSERELRETLPERLDWLWFLGYELSLYEHIITDSSRIVVTWHKNNKGLHRKLCSW